MTSTLHHHSSLVLLFLLVVALFFLSSSFFLASSQAIPYHGGGGSGGSPINNGNNNNGGGSATGKQNLRAQPTPRTARLLEKLTTRELLREMSQFDIGGLFDYTDSVNGGKYGWIKEDVLISLLENNQVGSLFNSPSAQPPNFVPDVYWYRKLQNRLWELSKAHGSKVPILYGIDSIHGASYVYNATYFPQQIATAATFNESHAYLLGVVSGKETRYAGIPWVFSPVLGIATQPSWARVFETFGEDPLLTSVMGVAVINGYQRRPDPQMFHGTTTKANHTVAGCAKHFVGYPDARTGRDRTPVEMPYNSLLQYYVPSFDAAINDPAANVLSIMENYIELNGKPVVASALILNFFLRSEDQLNFQGMLVTDYNEIFNLHDFHYYSESYEAAIFDSLNETTIDMAMVSGPNAGYPYISDTLNQLLQNNEMDEDRLRRSAARVLDLKDRLGLLGDDATSPVPPNQTAWSGPNCSFGCDEHHQYATDTVRESVTLLQNTGNVLPLNFNSMTNILIVGEACDNKGLMNGGWTVHWQGTQNDDNIPNGATIRQEIVRRYGVNGTEGGHANVFYSKGCNVTENSVCDPFYLQEVNDLIDNHNPDVVIMCLGETHYAEKPGDIFDLGLPGGQKGLVSQVASKLSASQKFVGILIQGRPRLLGNIPSQIPALLHAYLPGSFGGIGIVDILSGLVNPSGKLPITYPKTYNGAPVQYWRKYSANTNIGHPSSNDYTDAIQWPFGHGLSYTTFEYSNLTLGLSGNNITIQVNVKNTGNYAGKEVVMAYSTQAFRRNTPEVQMLRAFKKVLIQPGQNVTVNLHFSYLQLGYYDETNCKIFQSSPAIISVAHLQATKTFASLRKVSLEMQQCQGWGSYFLDHSAGANTYPTSAPAAPGGSEQDYFISSIVCFGAGIVITVIVVSFIRKRREKYNSEQNLLEPAGV